MTLLQKDPFRHKDHKDHKEKKAFSSAFYAFSVVK